MLELMEVVKTYGNTQILQNVSLRCEDGESLCLAGANAAGKTTLLTIAAGLRLPDGGTVRHSGKIGFVEQENTLLEDMSVLENLHLWYAAHGRPARDMFSPCSVEAVLELTPYAKKRVRSLSGGIKKRTAIACALAGDPECLFMDEPFTALDMAGRDKVADLIHRLCKRGKTILFSSHDPAAIASAAQKIALLREGTIVCIQALDLKSRRVEQIIELLSQA